MYTGVLEKDATQKQIGDAKKTVQVVIEVNDHKYVESFDGTNGLVVMVDTETASQGRVFAGARSMFFIIDALLDDMPDDVVVALLAKRIANSKPGDKFF
ncbi:hypothetical protein [Sporomusa malonica]|uniref:Uncharacterized protein n=1 Tax=Sporomusa malonica TaxID=112901 RepID=A0A1W2ATW0_9FIRM|nr:hypothetical protein [Sporomusa malonica]SMC64147.1 hypothetical protein SAMN04488500_106115 [Sporomusa malonica]